MNFSEPILNPVRLSPKPVFVPLGIHHLGNVTKLILVDQFTSENVKFEIISVNPSNRAPFTLLIMGLASRETRNSLMLCYVSYKIS